MTTAADARPSAQRLALWLLAPLLAACGAQSRGASATAPCPAQPTGEVVLTGGEFEMGAAPLRPEEGPPRRVRVAPFAIDRTEVTNAEFAAFVAATGYVTLAERKPDPRLYPGVDPRELKPSSLVFVAPAAGAARLDPEAWWQVVEGAQWRRPAGPGSSIGGRGREPVTQVAYEDALAYARWRGRDLPTEAEWEYAARGGLEGARYSWGDQPSTREAPRANHWQGVFPALDLGADGYKARPAPVGCFAANGFGLYDMAGNVWEWTRGRYGPGHSSQGAEAAGPDMGMAYVPDELGAGAPKHVIKGGSFLCSDDFCFRYRPAARQPGPPDTGASHVGFRTVRRLETPPGEETQG